MAKKTTVTDARIEQIMNRVYGIFVNDLRLKALRLRVREVTGRVSFTRFYDKALELIAGQDGHHPSKKGAPLKANVPEERLKAAVEKLAPQWNGYVAGSGVNLTVKQPVRK